MAIETLNKVMLAAPTVTVEKLLERLYQLSVMHVIDAHEQIPDEDDSWSRPAVNTEKIDARLRRLSLIDATFSICVKKKQSLIGSFSPLPENISSDDMADILGWDGLEELYSECKALTVRHAHGEAGLRETEAEIRYLSAFANMPFDTCDLRSLKRFSAVVGRMSKTQWRKMMLTATAEELLTGQLLYEEGKQAVVVIAWLEGQGEEALELLRSCGFLEMQVPDLSVPLSERIEELRQQKERLEKEHAEVEARITALANSDRRRVEILLGYWESETAKAKARNSVAISKRIAVIAGYVKAADMGALGKMLDAEFPGVSMVRKDPEPDERVPVSIALHPVFKPGRLLIDMFGMPDYFTFDPTPFVTGAFVLMFGLCLGDTIYGLLLTGLCVFMMKKYRDYPAVKDFFQLFLYCGVATTIAGIFTGTWCGDLYQAQYLGAGNPILRLRQAMQKRGLILDMLASPLAGLGLAMGIGVINQFYSIVLRLYRDARQGKWADAIFDAGLWLVVLPGMLILVATVFASVPAWLVTIGTWMFIGGAIGLILTQGRKEKGIVSKAVTGVVSIYGILGTYGCTSFIGDMLSYSRLLALGLTTTVVGMAFNIIAGMLKGFPVVGVLLFVLVAVMGHVFNFAISMLSGLVHSMRLMFLEMFSRFYEPNGVRFKALGFNSDRVRIVEADL